MKSKLILSIVSGAIVFATTAVFAETKDSVIGAYFNLEQALINQDLSGTKTAAADLAQRAQVIDESIGKAANDVAKADSIEQARQAFKTLSADTLSFIQVERANQATACSMDETQCMRTGTNAQSSCMASRTPSCGMMDRCAMMSRNTSGAGCGGM